MPSATEHLLHNDLERLDDALIVLRRLWQHPRLQQEFLARAGIHVEAALFRTLRAIERAERDEPGVGDVAEALGVDPSTASRFVDQAVCAGYAARVPSQQDRRRVVLTLTERGAALLEHANGARVVLLGQLTEGWSADDVRTLSTLLDRLRAATADLPAAPPPMPR